MLSGIRMMGALLVVAMIVSAQSPRFPAPLGVDRILTGVVVDCTKKTKRDAACAENSGYLLKVEDVIYTLHGHEDELAKHAGRATTITGNVVGNDVAVTSVRAPEK